ncbi:VOC family protein [Verticiella sediminum]|uniref:VOC family protein n=1 Tax=Verticiella sediminum TaxID=1247510 RepID=A0A556ACX2_9BURK|nr:VOC family protein [Verticiella sediminum]TSH90713.1 VOC family protein [Verticiella sediminum]
MLKHNASSAIVAVSDIDRARAFYSDVLGLDLVEGDETVMVFATGPTHLVVYTSDEAGTNRANAVVWDAGGDIEGIVAELAARGVRFERYELEGAEYRDGIHHAGEMKMAWFKDPDGNILHINQMPAG